VTDELTGLPNHRSFRDSLSREIKRALRDESALALVLFDIDDFKSLNDTYGHAVGDAILARVAALMRAELREVDLLARYGGEEFALLAPGTSLDGAVAIAEKVRMAISRASFSVLSLEGPCSLRVTVSAGVALFDGDERRLFNAADRALYGAKSAGKDCVVTG
jgi:diguanylate cyclase (GGDEF)-like protein